MRAEGGVKFPGWATAASGSTSQAPKAMEWCPNPQDRGRPGPAPGRQAHLPPTSPAAHSDAQGKRPADYHPLTCWVRSASRSLWCGGRGRRMDWGRWRQSAEHPKRGGAGRTSCSPQLPEEAVCKAAVISSHRAPHLIIILSQHLINRTWTVPR